MKCLIIIAAILAVFASTLQAERNKEFQERAEIYSSKFCIFYYNNQIHVRKI